MDKVVGLMSFKVVFEDKVVDFEGKILILESRIVVF